MLAVAALLAARPASAQGWPAAVNSFSLGLQFPEPIELGHLDLAAPPDPATPPAPRERTFWIGAVTVLAVAGSAWNSFGDGPSQAWHFENEGWFGQNTYVGGGDKASHFVSYYIVGRLLSGVFGEFGAPTDRARLLGTGVSALAGLVTEIGDGTTKYGFSYEDLILDWLGAATSLGILHYGLDDLIGFRAGLVPTPPAICCPYGGFGRDYSSEIYTADLKIAGLGKRATFNTGPMRYFLLSVSYSAKGYPYADPVVRERQVGFELGLNFGEIMRAIGVPPQKWWGKFLYFVFDVVRFPYTQVGMYYDLNTRQWRGPGIGSSWGP